MFKMKKLPINPPLTLTKKLRDWWLMDVTCSRPYRKLIDFKYALRNMIFRGHNNVRLTKFAGKDWVETDIRLFEAVFECLREFVEEQEGWLGSWTESRWTRWKMRWLPNRFRRQLSRRLAEKHWEWEMTDPDCGDVNEEGTQANRARKVKELYTWYMDVYNKAEDPWESLPEPPGGYKRMFDDDGFLRREEDTPEWKEYNAQSRAASEEEDRRYKEATDKAIEVLKIRDSLWT
jgi:hypothetical protein